MASVRMDIYLECIISLKGLLVKYVVNIVSLSFHILRILKGIGFKDF